MFSQNYMNQLQHDTQNKSVPNSVCELKREYYKAEPDKYLDMVIVPYRAGVNNPLVKKRVIAQGEWVFSLDLFLHSRIGADKKDYVCPKTWGEKCPICDLQYKIFKESGKDAASSLRATKRSWMNIALCDQQGSRYGEMLVFNPSYFLFTEKLLDAALAKNRGVGILPFADIERGCVISFHTTQEVLGKNKFVDYSSFDFSQRSAPVPQEFLRSAICFEDFLRMPDVNELMDLASDSSSWQFQPAGQPTPQPAPIYNQQPIPQAAPAYSSTNAPTAYNPQPANQHIQQPAPTYNPQPAPVYNPTPTGQMQPNSYPQPTYNPQPTGQDIMCPSGLRFGIDCDTKRECGFCEVWNACDERKKIALAG